VSELAQSVAPRREWRFPNQSLDAMDDRIHADLVAADRALKFISSAAALFVQGADGLKHKRPVLFTSIQQKATRRPQ